MSTWFNITYTCIHNTCIVILIVIKTDLICIIIKFWHNPKFNKRNCELKLTYDTPALRQTGSRNLTGQKTLPTIWGTYMKLVTKYQISAINSYWEKCYEKYVGRTEGQTDRGKTIYPPPPSGSGGIIRDTINCQNA